jgi:hypothetical protein
MSDWPDKPCPYCGVDSGEECVTPSGKTANDVHSERENLNIPDFYCPKCHAEPGEPCRKRSGEIASYIHSQRQTKFGVALGKLERFYAGLTESNEMPQEAKQLMKDHDRVMIQNNSLDTELDPDMKRKNDWQYDPPESRQINKNGQYVMIIDTEQLTRNDFDWIEPGMTFYASHCDNTDSTGFNSSGYYKICINTPNGDIHLWPHEYVPFDFETLSRLYSQDELQLHAREYDQNDLTHDVHYMMSRGISAKQALAMALGNIKKNIGWFEPTDELKKSLIEFLNLSQSEMFRNIA